MKIRIFSLISISTLFSIPCASAAISILNSASIAFSDSSATNNASVQTLSGFNAQGGKLIVAVGHENGVLGSVTYGGVTMNVGAQQLGNNARNIIYYLDNPAAGNNDIVLTFTTSNNGPGILALSLAGAASGGPISSNSAFDDSLTTDTSSIGITAASGDFVLANYVTQGEVGDITVNSPATEIGTFNGVNKNEIGSAQMAVGYLITTAAGTATINFDGGNSSRESIVIANFAAVPEPSVAILGALGGFCLLRRRR